MTQSLTPRIVLDTNVVLDWLLFKDPTTARISAALAMRQVRWIATASMRDEFAEVLRRGLASERDANVDGLLARWDTYAEMVGEPARLPAWAPLTCTDADDQKFLDLACGAKARWLLSRDRAVLRLARRAANWELGITAPEGWSAHT